MDQERNYSNDVNNRSYADLPMEIILQIFEYLNAADKKAISTTCRRWYEAFIDPKFQSQFVLKFSNVYLADNIQPLPTFLNCPDRPFINVYLEKVEMGAVNLFFKHVGPNVEELTIDSMDVNEGQVISILKEMRRLKHLTIKQSPEIFMSGRFLKSDDDKKTLQYTIENLDSLSIIDNRYLTDSLLSAITQMNYQFRHINLTGSPIAFHNAVCKRFYPQKNVNEPSEAILSFQFVREIINKYRGTLTELNLSRTLIGSAALESLADIDPPWQLKKLELESCLQLTMRSLIHFLATQTSIVYLNCSQTNIVGENWASKIVEMLPHLQVLKLNNCKTLTDCDVEQIATLKQLKKLDISFCSNLTSASIINGIAKDRNEVLEELNLSGLNINDASLMQCIEKIPNLTRFDVAFCVTAVTDEVVQMIAKNLCRLRELNLESCSLITDTGITGIECSTATTTTEPEVTANSRRLFENDHAPNKLKISLRSRAEEEIVDDANRKRALLAILENTVNLSVDHDTSNSIRRIRGLRVLNLGGCTKITDVSLKYGLAFRELATLSLSNCQQISFAGIQVLLQNCPSIENLDLSNCCNINNLTIELIAMRLKRLQFIDIRGCRQLTENYINDIHFQCRTLKV